MLKKFFEKKISLRLKTLIVLMCGLFFLQFSASSYELSFKVTPGAMLPFLSDNDYYYPVGFNTFLDAGININKFMNAGLSAGFFVMPKSNFTELEKGVNPTLTFVPLGAKLEFFGYPGSRLELCGGLALGVGIAINDAKTMYAPWYKAYGDLMYRISPSFSLGANVSFFDYQSISYIGNPGMAGLSVGISAKLKIETEKMVHNVKATVEQSERVFPLFASLYKENELGTAYIENNESAEIKNVKVSFRADGYTASDMLCGEIDKIYKHEVVEVPLYADFSNRIMQFSESGNIPAEIVIEYELLGKKRKTVESVIVAVHNRNQVRWYDPTVLAAYVFPKAEQVIDLTKKIAGLARPKLRTGINRNLQFSMYFFETIRLSGIECKADNSTPYAEYHLDSDLLDYIQYPFQTLLYKSGDVDDIGILFMSMLESISIEAGYIPLNNDFIVLINLGIDESKVGSMMDGTDRIIVIDGTVWVPVAMSKLREGFVNSWYTAINELFLDDGTEEDKSFYLLKDGWATYPASSFNMQSASADYPNEILVIAAVETDISRYLTTEFGPQIAAIQYQIKEKGATVELLNKLGLLYVRAGIYETAIKMYEQSAAMGSVAAMTNLGNLAVIQKRYVDAKVWYERALSLEPKNSTALKGLNNVLGKLED